LVPRDILTQVYEQPPALPVLLLTAPAPASQTEPDVFRGIDGGLPRRASVDVRPAKQYAPGRAGPDRPRPRRARRRDAYHFRACRLSLDDGLGGGGVVMAIDPASVDWGSASRASYLLRQTFRYEYPEPIRDLNHRLVVIPPERFGDQ